MAKARRKPPTLREKCASALLMLSRFNERNELVPLIPRECAKDMTAKEIVNRFDFDHGIYAAWGGTNHPTNLTPRLRAEHVEKTKRDAKNIAKVRRGLKKRAGEKRSRPMQYTAMKDTHKRDFRTGKVMAR